MGIDKIRRFHAPPDAPGGGSSSPESVEKGQQLAYYGSIREMRAALVPMMRRDRVDKASVYAYVGETSEQLGHFIASQRHGGASFEDIDGNSISFFSRRPVGNTGLRSVRRYSTTGRSISIEDWVRNKGGNPSTSTFDVFEYEEGDENETQQEADAKTTGESVAPVVANAEEGPNVVVPEGAERSEPETQMPSVDTTEPVTKIKARRLPKRRKPIKAERKARLAEAAKEDYQRLIEEARRRIHAISSTDVQTQKSATAAVHALAQFLNANPARKPEFEKALREESNVEVRTFLSLWEDDSHLSRSATLSASTKYLSRVAREVHDREKHSDPFRSFEAMHWAYESERDLLDYAYLFPEIPRPLFHGYLHSLGRERWLDIGAGETYRVPDSLMNALREINPQVQMIGLDPLYQEDQASVVDKARGRHKLDAVWAAKNTLVPGTAQTMSFDSASFDQVLSYYAFDKFNEANGGTKQALRQVARVLKPHGTARIIGMHREAFDTADDLEKYLTLKFRYDFEADNRTGTHFSNVVLVRNETSARDDESLQRDIEDWIARYATGGATGK